MKIYEVKYTPYAWNEDIKTAKVVAASSLQVLQWAVKPRSGLVGSGRVVTVTELYEVKVAK